MQRQKHKYDNDLTLYEMVDHKDGLREQMLYSSYVMYNHDKRYIYILINVLKYIIRQILLIGKSPFYKKHYYNRMGVSYVPSKIYTYVFYHLNIYLYDPIIEYQQQNKITTSVMGWRDYLDLYNITKRSNLIKHMVYFYELSSDKVE